MQHKTVTLIIIATPLVKQLTFIVQIYETYPRAGINICKTKTPRVQKRQGQSEAAVICV